MHMHITDIHTNSHTGAHANAETHTVKRHMKIKTGTH